MVEPSLLSRAPYTQDVVGLMDCNPVWIVIDNPFSKLDYWVELSVQFFLRFNPNPKFLSLF
jgi:hypothetical protein